METNKNDMRTFIEITESFKKFQIQKIELANESIAYCCKDFDDYFKIEIYENGYPTRQKIYRDINKFNNAIKRYITLQ